MRIGFGIILALTLSGPALASGDALPVAAGDEAVVKEVVHSPEHAAAARPSSLTGIPDAELPVLFPGGDPLFHLDEDFAGGSPQRLSFTPRSSRHACGDPGDTRCVAVAGPRLGIKIRHDLAKRPACRVRKDGAPAHATAVARDRVLERSAPLLFVIPIDGVKIRPIERASTC